MCMRFLCESMCAYRNGFGEVLVYYVYQILSNFMGLAMSALCCEMALLDL